MYHKFSLIEFWMLIYKWILADSQADMKMEVPVNLIDVKCHWVNTRILFFAQSFLFNFQILRIETIITARSTWRKEEHKRELEQIFSLHIKFICRWTSKRTPICPKPCANFPLQRDKIQLWLKFAVHTGITVIRCTLQWLYIFEHDAECTLGSMPLQLCCKSQCKQGNCNQQA